MIDTAELPVIDEAMIAPPSPRTEVAVAAAAAVDLAKLDLTAVALAQFGPWREKTAKLLADNKALVLELSIQSKIDEAKSLRERTINAPIAAARKVSTALKSKLAQTSKAVGAELDALVLAYDAAGEPLTKLIDEAQAKIDAAKEAARKAEEERLAGLRAAVDDIMARWLARAKVADITAERIGLGVSMLADLAMPAEAADVSGHWTTAKAATLEAMRELQRAAAQREQAAEVERLRLLAEQQEAELAALRAKEAERLERERIAELEAGAPKPQDDEMVLVDAAAPLTQSAPGGSGATQQGENSHDDQGDGQCPRGLAGEGDDGGPGQRRESVERAGDDRRTEHGAGLLHPLAPRDAGQGVAARLTITQNAQEGSVPADTPAVCASSEPEASNGSPSGSEGAAAQEVLRAADPAHGGTRSIFVSRGVVLSPPATSFREADQRVTEILHARGQGGDAPAEAGPRVIFAEPEPEDDLPAQTAAFVALVLTAFNTKFPSQPKPSVEWWAQVRQAGEALRDKLGQEGA